MQPALKCNGFKERNNFTEKNKTMNTASFLVAFMKASFWRKIVNSVAYSPRMYSYLRR